MATPQTGKPSFSVRRPVLAVFIIELLLLLAVFAAGAVATVKQLDYTSPVLMSFTPMAVVLIIYLTLRRRWAETGFCSLRTIPVQHAKYYIPLLLVLGTIALKGFAELTLAKVTFFIFLRCSSPLWKKPYTADLYSKHYFGRVQWQR